MEVSVTVLGGAPLLSWFASMAALCIRALILFWTRVMVSETGGVWVGCCTGLSGFCSALRGRALPIHHVSLTGVLFLGRLVLQMLQVCSSGLFSSYVQLEHVHVVVGGFA